MRQVLAAIIMALVLPVAALAQTTVPSASITTDQPPGFPYNTAASGPTADASQVPLRDFLSGRIDQLREYLVDIINERDKRYNERFQAQQDAISKAEAATAVHFASINGLNQRLEQQAKEFPGRGEIAALEKSLSDKIASNAAAIAVLDNRLVQLTSRGAGVNDAWVYLGGGVAVLVGLLVILGYWKSPPTHKPS